MLNHPVLTALINCLSFAVGAAGVRWSGPEYRWIFEFIFYASIVAAIALLLWWFFRNFRIQSPFISRRQTNEPPPIPIAAAAVQNRVCEFGKYQWKHERIDARPNHGGNQEFFRLNMPIKFIANAKAVTIRVSVMREITWYLDRRSPQYSWKVVESKDYYSGDSELVTFATVAVNRQHHGHYGDMREDARLINGTSRHVFTFDVFYDGGKDSTRLYLESPTKGVSANPPEGLGKLAGLIILQESDNVFAEDWATKGTPAPSAQQSPNDGPLWT